MIAKELRPLIRWLHLSGFPIAPQLVKLPGWLIRLLSLWSIVSFILVQIFLVTSLLSLIHWIEHASTAKELKITIIPLISDIIRQISVTFRALTLLSNRNNFRALLNQIDDSMRSLPHLTIKPISCKKAMIFVIGYIGAKSIGMIKGMKDPRHYLISRYSWLILDGINGTETISSIDGVPLTWLRILASLDQVMKGFYSSALILADVSMGILIIIAIRRRVHGLASTIKESSSLKSMTPWKQMEFLHSFRRTHAALRSALIQMNRTYATGYLTWYSLYIGLVLSVMNHIIEMVSLNLDLSISRLAPLMLVILMIMFSMYNR